MKQGASMRVWSITATLKCSSSPGCHAASSRGFPCLTMFYCIPGCTCAAQAGIKVTYLTFSTAVHVHRPGRYQGGSGGDLDAHHPHHLPPGGPAVAQAVLRAWGHSLRVPGTPILLTVHLMHACASCCHPYSASQRTVGLMALAANSTRL
jgi:hypothetical protein